MQVFGTNLPEGDRIASVGLTSRSVGNLRQRSYLGSLAPRSPLGVVYLVGLSALSCGLAQGAEAFELIALLVLDATFSLSHARHLLPRFKDGL